MLLILKVLVAILVAAVVSLFHEGYAYMIVFLTLLCLELLSVGINYGKKSDMYYLLYTGAYVLTALLAYFQMPLVAIGLVIVISIKRNHYIQKLDKAIKNYKSRTFNKKLKQHLRTVNLENKRARNNIYNAHFKNFFDYENNKRSMYVYKD